MMSEGIAGSYFSSLLTELIMLIDLDPIVRTAKDPILTLKATIVRDNGRNNSQQCCVPLHRAKSLTGGFKLCATTPSNTQQHATGCANGRNM